MLIQREPEQNNTVADLGGGAMRYILEIILRFYFFSMSPRHYLRNFRRISLNQERLEMCSRTMHGSPDVHSASFPNVPQGTTAETDNKIHTETQGRGVIA